MAATSRTPPRAASSQVALTTLSASKAKSCSQPEKSFCGMSSANVVANGASTNGVALTDPTRPTMRSRISGIFGHKNSSIIELPRMEFQGDYATDEAADGCVWAHPLPSQQASTVKLKEAITPHPRFWMNENGDHEHSVESVKRQGKLSDMLQNLMPRKTRNSHKEEQPLNLMSNWVEIIWKEKERFAKKKSLSRSPRTLAQKYGRCGHVIGSGAFGTVRIAHKSNAEDPMHEQLFAVKELKQHARESVKRYHKRLIAEFCLSSSMHHPNVITTLDLLKNAKGVYCQVMEYCSGGDLHTLVLAAGQLEVAEADCFFKQLIRGVEYMHEMGVAHRDLKPENLLLTQRGTIKITDFGNAECFRTAWETEVHMTAGVCGSAPYIAPEEYVDKEFDPRAVDVWACGIIYMAMRTGNHLWRVAQKGRDGSFERYLEDRKEEAGYKPIEDLRRSACLNIIYSALDPIPKRRLTAHQVLLSEWVKKIEVCHAGNGGVRI